LMTSRRMTSLQFPSGEDSRDSWTEAQRFQEMETWTEIISHQNAQEIVDQRLIEGISRQLGPIFRDSLQSQIGALQASQNLQLVTEEFERRLKLLSLATEQEIETIRGEAVEQVQIETEEFERRLKLLSLATEQEIETIRSETVEQVQNINLQLQLNERKFSQAVEAIQSTVSWRITAPLRRVRKCFPRK